MNLYGYGICIESAAVAIKQAADRLDRSMADGGFASRGSMSDYDMQAAERMLRALADKVAEKRRQLLACDPKGRAA